MADNGEHSRAQLPLLGVVLCCTSILPEERSEIAAIAGQMGAVHKLDLTSDVTHLLVGGIDTPKYKFVAKERPDVKCLLPTWIEAVRQSWMEGGETEVEALETKHKLPTLTGLRICVTGFEDLSYRKELEVLINASGGEYRGNLTKDVTHLIAKVPSGNKFVYAGHWGVKTVAIEWLEQSLERGMILDEESYNLLLPEEERGRNAWISRTKSTSSLGKRPRDAEVTSNNPRQLRRTASAKLSNQSAGLWTDIVGGGVRAEESNPNQWNDKHRETTPEKVTTKAEGMFQATKSSSDQVIEVDTIEIAQERPGSQPSSISALEVDVKPLLPKPLQKEGLFQGKVFVLHGFKEKQTSILQEHLLSHGAQIVSDVTHLPERSENGYLLIPHTSSTEDVPPVPDTLARPTVINDMWVERCLFRKEFVDPQANVTNTPFARFPIPGFEKLTVCSTAFQGTDLLHMSKAVKLMGATYDEFFSPDATVLLCNITQAGREKLRHALYWNVPAVTANWLWDSIRTGLLQSFDPYLVQPCPADPPEEHKKIPERISNNERGKKSSEKPPPREKLIGKVVKPDSLSKEKLGALFSREEPAKQPTSSRTDHERMNTPNEDSSDSLATLDTSLDNSLHTLQVSLPPPESLPLQEISPNPSPSPPKPTHSPKKAPPKPPSPPKPLPPSSRRDSLGLGSTISSLLAAHQNRSSTIATSTTDTSLPRMGRRRRQLLGRATSNLSNHSNGSIGAGLSRASSVDTVNTDGLGTPLDASGVRKNSLDVNMESLKALHYTELVSPNDGEEKSLQQSTQVGYEDPDVRAWRERVMRKMGGGGGGDLEGGDGKVGKVVAGRRITGTVVNSGKGVGVAGRTRGSVRGV